MKKLTLTPNAFDKGEVLTRTQLKKVMGGSGSGSGHGCTHYYTDGTSRCLGTDYTTDECRESCSHNPSCSYTSSYC